MEKDLNVLEMEFQELASYGFENCKFCLRIKTTPATYHEDFANLVVEVKTRLNEILSQKKAGMKKK